jgi:hypothetical protein
MKIYSLESCNNLIDKYVNTYKGYCEELQEGCLGLGTILLHSAEGKKTIVIQEICLNEWSSGHTIRMYNKMPKKYASKLRV